MGVEILPGDGRVEVGRAVLHCQAVVVVAGPAHTHIFPKGVVHRVEIGWGLTKVAVVLLNGLLW